MAGQRLSRIPCFLILSLLAKPPEISVVCRDNECHANGGHATMTSTAEPFERIDVNRAKELIDSGEIALIDVREENEWDDNGYIAGATRISVNDIISMQAIDELPTDQPIVFYCAAGVRSALASELAASVGVQGPLYSMEGGFDAWTKAGLPSAKD